MDLARLPSYAAFQHVRDIQCPSDLLRITCATIWHDAGAADCLEVGHLGQLGQNAVLDTIGKKRALFGFAQIFKGQNGDSSHYWTVDYFAFPSHDPDRCSECKQERSHCRNSWIASRPAQRAHRHRNRTRDDMAACEPAFKIFGQIPGRAITGAWFAL